jgi:hypothetical protein
MRKKRCETCEFWVLMKHSVLNEGNCHRHAPRPTNTNIQLQVMTHLTSISWYFSDDDQRKEDFNTWGDSPDYAVQWPVTEIDAWCGEWKKREE